MDQFVICHTVIDHEPCGSLRDDVLILLPSRSNRFSKGAEWKLTVEIRSWGNNEAIEAGELAEGAAVANGPRRCLRSYDYVLSTASLSLGKCSTDSESA